MADTKKSDSTTDPQPVGSAAKNISTEDAAVNDSMSLPLSGKSGNALLAGESSDPAVHQLLAERQALQMNRDTIAPPVDKDALKAVDDKITEVDKQLAGLGYKA